MTGRSIQKTPRSLRTLLTLFFLLLSLAVVRTSFASYTAVMKVYMNTVDKGEYFIMVDDDESLLAATADLREMGIVVMPIGAARKIDGRSYMRLDAIPGLEYEIDESAAALRITAKPGLLKKQTFDLTYKNPYDVENVIRNSAFLNYGVTYTLDADHELSTLSIPWEIGINVDRHLAFSSFSYTKTDTNKTFVRLMSNLTTDSIGRGRRYVLGDYFSKTSRLAGGGVFAGASVTKNYSMSPYLVTRPTMDFYGTAATPSEVELYVNDYLVRTERVAPGEFEISNFSMVSGAGDAKVVVRDAFGRETTIERPFYLSSLLLRPGLHDYHYGLGFKRKAFGIESSSYGELAFVASHSYGFSRGITAGFAAEADRNTANFGPEARFTLWRLGEMDTAAAASFDDGVFGYSGVASYYYTTRGFNARLSARHNSRDYATVATTAATDKPRLQWTAGAGFSSRLLGSLSVTYTDTDNYVTTDNKRTTIFYTRMLLSNLILNVTATRTKFAGAIDDIYASLNYFFGPRYSGDVTYSVQDHKSTESVRFQRSTPLGKGLGYTMQAIRREGFSGDKHVDGTANMTYRGTYGSYGANYTRVFGTDTYSLNTSGALVFVGNSLYPTRSVYDSFAVVKVGSAPGVTVSYNNQRIGKTNGHGELVLPDIISYYDNIVSIDERDLPLNYEVSGTERHVSTSYRGGGLVNFRVRRLQSFTGNITVHKDGASRPADYATLTIYTDTGPVETLVGLGGEFYVENLEPGSYRSLLIFNRYQCNMDLRIPDRDEMSVDLGELSCTID